MAVARKFEPKSDAFYNIRRSPEVVAAVESLAARVAAAAGPGFGWDGQQGARNPQGRWRAIVYPETMSARARNARDNTLVSVLGSVRL